ncbi:MAG: tetratricopeptide repeat protein [Desulfobacteraceae bacterium]|nr:tetratricopeptide repeat protein [Desulfobacteraceae bacterium]
MKRIFVAVFCILLLVSCASSSATNTKNRKIAQAIHQEGKAYFAHKRYSIALGKYLQAVKTIPDDRFLQYDIGITYMILDEYTLAERHFKKAIELEPDFMPAMNALGVAYLKQKKWDKAIECLNKSVNNLLYATPHYSLTNLGWAYLGKKNYKLANDYFLQALKKVPNYLRALHGFVNVSLETNQEYIALRKLDKAIKKLPESMIIHYDFARIYEKLGQYSKAEEYWKKVIDLAPEESTFKEEAEDKLRNY